MDFLGDLIAAPFICLGWLIVGALAGTIAHNVMKSSASLIGDIIIGLIGAVIGGFIFNILGIARANDGLTGVIVSLIVATVGAIVIIAVVRVFRGQRVA